MNEHSDRIAGDVVNEPVLGETPDAGHDPRQEHASAVVSRYHPCPRWLALTLIVTAALVFVAWLFLAAAHIDDRYQLDHVSGARMALAQSFDRGTLYPELYDGRTYGGTRFMPLPIVLHGLTARMTGEYLVAGKLLGYAATLGLLATMFDPPAARPVPAPLCPDPRRPRPDDVDGIRRLDEHARRRPAARPPGTGCLDRREHRPVPPPRWARPLWLPLPSFRS